MLPWILTALLAYLFICAGMYVLQRKLDNIPDKTIEAPAHYGLDGTQDITLTSKDGTRLQAWLRPAAPGFPTLVYFHGNAANLAFRAPKFIEFTRAGFGLLALHYRGYGHSEGSPDESGIYDDARAAMEYARDTLHLPPSQTVLYGESLGTGVAVQMGTEYDVAALVLEAPYTSVETRAAELYPYLPTRLILKDKFYSEMKIKSVHAPLLILQGDKDMVIPIRHGRKLFGLANEPKAMIEYPGIGHTDFDLVKLTADMVGFLRARAVIAVQKPDT